MQLPSKTAYRETFTLITALKNKKTRGYFGRLLQYTKGQELRQSKPPFLEPGTGPQTNTNFTC